MCIGLPARVLRVVGEDAYVDIGRRTGTRVALAVPERVSPGDFVILLGNVAVGKTSRREAIQALKDLKEMAILAVAEDGRDSDAIALSYDKRIRQIALESDPRRGS